MYIIKVEPRENFEIWHLFNAFTDAAAELVSFIDAGILESAPGYFKTLFDEAVSKITAAYAALISAVNKTQPKLRNVDWKLNYSTGIYEITQSSHEFDPKRIVLNTMKLRPSFYEKVAGLAGVAHEQAN